MTRRLLTDRRRRQRGAFTLVEALVAISITAIAGGALLLGISSSLQSTKQAVEETIATGMARQLLDEVVGARYYAADSGGDPYQTYLGPSSYESSGKGRERYDDIDDYNGVRSRPPTDPWGVELGTGDGEGSQRHASFRIPPHFLDNWQQEIDVYYVDPSDLTKRLPAGRVSDYRVVEVRIALIDPDRGRRELASIRQVIAYVPQM